MRLSTVDGQHRIPRAMTSIHATPAHERSTLIDGLRGLAVVGILLANVLVHYVPSYSLYAGVGSWPGTLDRLSVLFMRVFIEGKFLSIFSFLFGLGFMLQLERRQAQGVDFKRWYRRRLIVLAGFAAAHYTFLWHGDILGTYAVLVF